MSTTSGLTSTRSFIRQDRFGLSSIRSFVRQYRFELILLLPLFLYVLGMTMLPVLQNILYSFQAPTGAFPSLDSYRQVFDTYRFTEALRNTLIISLLSVTLELVLGLGFALMLNRAFAGRGLFRAILLLPMGIPGVVAATNMRYIFASSGYFNQFLYLLSVPLANIGLLAKPYSGINWLETPYVLYTVAISDMWKVTPLVMLILLAGLQSIPGELYEAAEVDGATRWQQFWGVTLPLLRPAIISAVVIRGIDAFRIFVQPLALGVSGKVPVLSSLAYNQYTDGNLTLSAATSTVLLFIILVAVISFLRIFGTKEIVG